MPDMDPLEMASLLGLTLRSSQQAKAEVDFVEQVSQRNRSLHKEIDERNKRLPGS